MPERTQLILTTIANDISCLVFSDIRILISKQALAAMFEVTHNDGTTTQRRYIINDNGAVVRIHNFTDEQLRTIVYNTPEINQDLIKILGITQSTLMFYRHQATRRIK